MGGFLRLLLGILLLPACGGVTVAAWRAICRASAATGFTAEAIALLGGISAFVLVWLALPHPIRTYVLGHELTHALWGLFFGAVPSDFRVSRNGGQVRLTKSNVLITLAPYFFPFYTFVVILAALITFAFIRPLPYLPLWMFLIGFTWAFHILFTLSTLVQKQPDITLYGRLFSYAVILIANILLVLVALATMTPLTFADLGALLYHQTAAAYIATYQALTRLIAYCVN